MTTPVAASPVPILQFFGNNGQPLAGGSILTQVGGINTATYQDSAGATPLPNPIPLNSRGEISNASGQSCQLFLQANVAYTFTFSDAGGNQIWVATYVAGSSDPNYSIVPATDNTFNLGSPSSSWANLYLGPNHAPALSPGGNIGFYPKTALETAASLTITDFSYPPGNVLRYGADPTGAVDSTFAFQQATFSTYSGWAPTSSSFQAYQVVIPKGRYKMAGVNTSYGTATVYVRAGMSIVGAGMGTIIDASAAAWNTQPADLFRCGWGFISGVATQDPGGQPPEFAFMFILGGPAGGGAAVGARFNGGLLHDVWFSAPGLGVYQSGFNIYDCVFDIGLQGIVKGFGTEEYIEGCTFFNQSGGMIVFDTSITSDCSELVISECQFNYPQATAIIIGSGGAGNNYQNIRISDCSFISNFQYGGFAGYVSIAASNIAQLEFNDCTFRNMPGYAVQIVSANALIDFNHCVFDGKKTNATYTQSTTAGGVTISSGTLRMNNCQWRNLSNNSVVISGGNIVVARFNGVQYTTNTASTFFSITNTNSNSSLFCKDVDGDGSQALLNAQAAIQVKLKNLNNWWGAQLSSGAYNYVLLPYQHSSAYQITLSANLNSGGSGSYSKSASIYATKMNDFNGSATSFITTATAIADPSETGSGGNAAIALNVLFGGVPGTGTSTVANSNSGSLFVSWPNTYSNISLDIQPIGGGFA